MSHKSSSRNTYSLSVHTSDPATMMMPPPRSPLSNKTMFKANKISLNTKPPNSTPNMGARWGHSSCLVDRRLFIIGGIGNNLVHDTCLFDFGTLSWIEAHTSGKSPGARYGHSTVLFSSPSVLDKTSILLFGGRNISKKYFNDLYLLDTSSMVWTCFPTDKNFPDPRAGHTAILVRHSSLPFARLVVFGGNYHNKYLNSVYIMDIISPDNFQWCKPSVKGTPPCPRSGHTSTHIPNTTKMLVFGGFDGKKCFNDAGTSGGDIVLQWLPQPTLPLTISPRFHHSCDIVDRSIIIFGGCASGALFNDMISLDVSPLLESEQTRSVTVSTTTTTTTNGGPSTTSVSTSTSTPTPATPPPTSAPLSTSTSTLTQTTDESNTPESTTSNPVASPLSTSQTLPPTSTTESSTQEVPSNTPTPLSPVSHEIPLPPNTEPIPSPTPVAQNSSPHPPLTVLHAVTSFNVPTDIGIIPSSKQSKFLQDEKQALQEPSALELCLTSALASLNSEQQKLKDMELQLAREKASHASLRADFVSEQIKVKELEERLSKTEKLLRKSQKVVNDGKHSHQDLQKAQLQISSLRSELSKMTEKYETERRQHNTSHHSQPQQPAPQPTTTTRARAHSQPKPIQEQLHGMMELFTMDNLDLLEMPALTQLQTANIKASENIAAAKDKKLAQLIANMENMRLELVTQTQQQQEKEVALKDMSEKYSELEKEHEKEKENLRHLVGEGLETMDTAALEKLENIHHTGLRNVGMAKTQALAQQVARLQREKEELSERVVCVVCADAQINTVLSPCGHRCMCKQCADLLSNCPLCRKPIANKLQYFP